MVAKQNPIVNINRCALCFCFFLSAATLTTILCKMNKLSTKNYILEFDIELSALNFFCAHYFNTVYILVMTYVT